jgi:vancomycin resistance protein YoaR
VTELVARISRRRVSWTALTLVLVALVAGAGLFLRARSYQGEAVPGVRVAGVDVGGLTQAQAERAIAKGVDRKLARPVILAVAGRELSIEPRQLLRVDGRASARAALEAGRGSLFGRIVSVASPVAIGRDVDPILVRRGRLARLMAGLDRLGGRKPVKAKVTLRGTVPVVRPSRSGRRLDERAFVAALTAAALSARPPVVRPEFDPVVPRLRTLAATDAAHSARVALSAPVTLTLDGKPLGSLPPATLARVLRFKVKGDRILVFFRPKALVHLLDPRIGAWKRQAVNARFGFSGDRVHVIPSRAGVGLDPVTTAGAITAAAYSPTGRTADLTVGAVQPDITTDDLAALGITRKLVSYTTEMGESSSNRIWNVHLMANFIDGTIIRPGQTFSFNRVVGPRTEERGFREGQMIVGSLLLPAIGGGVCQTATTLFNGAFELGLPILERHNHSFYISHYPLGRDATVSWGGPDLVFRNDLRHGLLIKASYTDSTLTFTWYGTPQGRRIVATTGPKTNWKQPKTSYAYDPYGQPRSIRTEAGSGELGFDVTVSRTVYEGGRLLRRGSFPSKYVPVGPTVVYGPGTHPPRIDFVLPKPG